MTWPVQGQAPKPVGGFGRPRPARWESMGLPSPERRHVGVDIGAPIGSVLVATEPATVHRIQGWTPGTKAILLLTDRNHTILYGPIVPGSWRGYGLSRGSRVAAGRAIGRLAPYPGEGSTPQLHFEVYAGPVGSNIEWQWGEIKPDRVLDPAPYLADVAHQVGNGGPIAYTEDSDGSGLLLAAALLLWGYAG